MNDHAGLVRIARFRPSSGRRDDVVYGLRMMADTARQAEGCFGAQVATSDLDPESVVLVSRWESREALERFGSSAGFERARGRLQPLLGGPPEFEFFTTA
jgi:quinol monooxygenase YgiN